jgi:hypothetical protein
MDIVLKKRRHAFSLPVGAGANRLSYIECLRRVVACLLVDLIAERRVVKLANANRIFRQILLRDDFHIRGGELQRWRKWLCACRDPDVIFLVNYYHELVQDGATELSDTYDEIFGPDFRNVN